MRNPSDVQLLGAPIVRGSSQPAHLQVRQRLVAYFQARGLREGDPLPSEVDIAEALGVSRMTANKAILGLVSDGWLLREKGRGTYLAHPGRQSVKRCLILAKKAASVGLQDDYYYGALYWGVREFFGSHDIRIDFGAMEPSSIPTLASAPDTVLIAFNPDLPSAQKLADLASAGIPVVALGSSWEGGRLDTVDSDNQLGSALAVNHLVDLGHERIAFVGALIQDSNTVDRLRGFRFAMRARGLEAPDSQVIIGAESGFLEPGEEQKVAAALRGPRPITAVVAAGSGLAMNVLSLASRLGVRVPESLSIVAYDDPKFISLTHPPLTTVRQPLDEMAALACQIVMDRASGPAEGFRQEVLDPSLVIRESTASPEGASVRL